MKTLSKKVFDCEFDVKKFIEEKEQVIQFLKSLNKKNCAATYVRNLVALLKNVKNTEEYSKCMTESFPRGQYAETQKRPKDWNWERIVKVYNNHKSFKQSRGTKKAHLLLAFYVELIPLRHQCFLELNWKSNEEKSNNYIDLENKKMYVRTGKTFAKYGETIYDLNDVLVEAITDYKNNWSVNPIRLFSNSQRQSSRYLEAVRSPTMSEFITKNVGISSNQIRKLFVSDVVMKNPDKKYRNDIARKMLHSAGIQALCYSQYEM